jgi:hypothetical protein
LAEAMTVLVNYPILPTDLLQGRLRDQENVPPTTALQPGRLQSIGEFWQALGGNPKAAFDYTVTIGLQSFDAKGEGLVTKVELEVEPQRARRPQSTSHPPRSLTPRYEVRYRKG